jgi:hypothetical protein
LKSPERRGETDAEQYAKSAPMPKIIANLGGILDRPGL